MDNRDRRPGFPSAVTPENLHDLLLIARTRGALGIPRPDPRRSVVAVLSRYAGGRDRGGPGVLRPAQGRP